MIQGILLGGDQLSTVMARRVISERQNSMTQEQCLKGLVPVVEDWHAKLCFLVVRLYAYYTKHAECKMGGAFV